MKIRTALLMTCLLFVSGASAEQRFDVFFLAIGSGSYMGSRADGVMGLPSIPGAAKSAKAVADLLERGGSMFGITLLSDSNHFVGLDDIHSALSDVLEKIRKTRPRRPLIVFYFAGHGISEGAYAEHFLLPGNFLYRGDIDYQVSDHLPEFGTMTLQSSFLVDWLKSMDLPFLPFLVLLDTCYQFTPVEFGFKRSTPLPDTPWVCPPGDIIGFCASLRKELAPLRRFETAMEAAAKSQNEFADKIRRSNRFEKNMYPVLFSAEPGSWALTVADPFDSDPRATAVAPLARRAMLILDPVLKRGESLSLKGFIQQMTSPTVDRRTAPAVTYSPLPEVASLLLVTKVSRQGAPEVRLGTATQPAICCGDSSDP